MLTEPWLIPGLSLIITPSPLCGARKDWNDKLLISLGTTATPPLTSLATLRTGLADWHLPSISLESGKTEEAQSTMLWKWSHTCFISHLSPQNSFCLDLKMTGCHINRYKIIVECPSCPSCVEPASQPSCGLLILSLQLYLFSFLLSTSLSQQQLRFYYSWLTKLRALLDGVWCALVEVQCCSAVWRYLECWYLHI